MNVCLRNAGFIHKIVLNYSFIDHFKNDSSKKQPKNPKNLIKDCSQIYVLHKL